MCGNAFGTAQWMVVSFWLFYTLLLISFIQARIGFAFAVPNMATCGLAVFHRFPLLNLRNCLRSRMESGAASPCLHKKSATRQTIDAGHLANATVHLAARLFLGCRKCQWRLYAAKRSGQKSFLGVNSCDICACSHIGQFDTHYLQEHTKLRDIHSQICLFLRISLVVHRHLKFLREHSSTTQIGPSYCSAQVSPYRAEPIRNRVPKHSVTVGHLLIRTPGVDSPRKFRTAKLSESVK